MTSIIDELFGSGDQLLEREPPVASARRAPSAPLTDGTGPSTDLSARAADTLFSLAIAGDGARPRSLAAMGRRDVDEILEDLAELQAAGLAVIWAAAPTARGRELGRRRTPAYDGGAPS